MSKTLQTIQKLAKIGKILSTIVYVCCIVGTVGCAIGIISFALIPGNYVIGNVTIHGLIESSAETSVGTIYASMGVGLVLCLAEVIVSGYAKKYFKNELEAGTPFTREGAKELTRLGIYAIVAPIVAVIIASIIYAVISACMGNVADVDFDGGGSVGLGIGFIIMGLICRYGAELYEDAPSEEDDLQ